MTVDFAPNELRRSLRFATPVRVRLDAGEYPVVDWSFEGFRLAGLDWQQPLEQGQVLATDLVFSFPDEDRVVTTRGRVLWSDDDEAGVQFLELSPAARSVMQAHVERYLPRPLTTASNLPAVGRVHPATTPGRPRYPGQRPMPAHVVDVRTSPEADEIEWSSSPSPVAVLARVAALAILTVAVLIALSALWRAQGQVESITAQVAGRSFEVGAPGAGVLAGVAVFEGDAVTAGQALFELDAGPVQARIEALERLADEQRALVDETDSALSAEYSTANLGASLAGSRLAAAQARRAEVEAEVKAAQRDLEAIEPLARKGMLPMGDLNTARTRVAQAEARLGTADAAVSEARAVRNAGGRGMSGAARSQVPSLQAALGRARADLVALELEIADLRGQLAATRVLARQEGRVLEVLASAGQTLERGQPVVAVGVPGRRWVEAEFDFKSARRLKPGNDVELYVPALDRTVVGRVGSIAPAEGGPNTAAIPVRIELDSPPADLELGMGALATVETAFRLPWQRGA
jgi:membrane fusion protein (multidrug efflux system)